MRSPARISFRQVPRVAGPRRPFARPRLLALEGRDVPATITVNNNLDTVAVDGTVSLREALNSFNAGAPANADVVPVGGPFGTDDEVLFSGVVSPIALPSGQLTISTSVRISGPGAALLTVKNTAAASTTARVFNISAGTNANIVGLTVTGGNATTNGGGIATAGTTTLTDVVVSRNKTTTDGGGIAVSAGSLTLNNSLVDSNQATLSSSQGGGVRVASSQTVTLNDATVSNNSSGEDGGGIYFFSGGTLNLNRSTVSGNRSNLLATGAGGGGTYLFNTATTITNSTISGNSTATAGKASPGGGISSLSGAAAVNVRNSTIAFNDAGTSKGGGFSRGGTAVVTLDSTIISNNTATTDPDATGTIATANQSLIQNLGALVINTNNGTQLGVDPLLGALTDALGGATKYHVPGAGSPALDKGNNNSGAATDQRGAGFVRSVGGAPDIGAVELQPAVPPTVTSVKVNGGGLQRSMITSIVVTFSEAVSLPAIPEAAFALSRVGQPTGGPHAAAPLGTTRLMAAPVGNVVTLTFLNGGAVPLDIAGSLIDGRYQLKIDAAKVQGPGGGLDADGDGDFDAADVANGYLTPPTGAGSIFRLFGDFDGDADTDVADFGAALAAFGGATPAFDSDGDGDVDAVDFGRFRQRFGAGV